MPRPRHFGARVRTAADRRNDAVKFLAFARPEKLIGITAEALAAQYGIKLAVAAELLGSVGRG